MSDLFILNQPVLPFQLPPDVGYAAAWNEQANGFDINVPGGRLFYSEGFFNQAWSDRAVAFMQENEPIDWRTANWRAVSTEALGDVRFTNIQWRQDELKLYGRRIPLPRLTAWYGDPGAAYTYSGIKSEPNPWNEGLSHIRRRIEPLVGVSFNCVLLNWYRDGRDSLSWHADNEEELGRDPVIASANFGEARDFQLRRNSDHREKITIPLNHGSVLVMAGELQRHWQHAVPKRSGVTGSRFNLTFRTINC